jgi:hypothetical protein
VLCLVTGDFRAFLKVFWDRVWDESFSANFEFGAQLSQVIFKISNPNFGQLMTIPKRYFASKSTNKWLRYHQKKVEKQEKIQ